MKLEILENIPKKLKLFEGKEIRTLVNSETEEIWFVAQDIFQVLGKSSKSGNDFEGLDEDELSVFKIHSGGQMRDFKIVSESGFYSLVMKSRKQIAKPFQKWVSKDVLPSIRKNGFYISKEAKESPSEELINVATGILNTRKATDLKRVKLISVIASYLDTQDYSPRSLQTALVTVYQHLHIKVSGKLAVNILEDELKSSKDNLTVQSTNQLRNSGSTWLIDYTSAMNYYKEEDLDLFDKSFNKILQRVVDMIEMKPTKNADTVISLLKKASRDMVYETTDYISGTTFQGKLANDLKTLIIEYMKGDVLFNEVINLVDDIAGGRSFTLGKS